MKLLFIYTNIGTFNPPNFQHGVACLSSFVRHSGHETALVSLDEVVSEREFIDSVSATSPDIVGFHANSPQWAVTRGLGTWLKAAFPELVTVYGGTHPTTRPEDVLRSGVADYIVRGEGEHALVELLEALEHGRDPGSLANLGRIVDGGVVLNPVRPLIPDLDALPAPDRSIFDFQRILDANLGEAPYMAGRGCPYSCTYCCNNFLQRIYRGKGRSVRLRSPRRVVDELAEMVQTYHFRSIYFQDDTFVLDKRWLAEFARLYAAEIGVPYRAQARVDLIDDEILELLVSSGCRHMNFGIEAGDERIRREVMGRNISDEQIVTAFNLARSYGLKLWSYNIIGTPGEGEPEIRRTIELNRELEPDHVQVSIFNPYPGTELYKRCVCENRIDPQIADDGLPRSFFVDVPRIKREEISDGRLKELYDEFVQLGLLLAARRTPHGYYDFLDRFESAEIDAGGASFVNLQLQHFDDDERLCLFEHPTSRVSFKAPLHGPSSLRFGIALNPQVWDKDIDGVRFAVEVDGAPVFSQEINPARNPAHRGWLDQQIELAGNGGKHATISFITEPIGRADFGWALWSRPHLVKVGGL
jgi:anaerobic magnesium-protoporphyrin IX monomethyl ester cyclase